MHISNAIRNVALARKLGTLGGMFSFSRVDSYALDFVLGCMAGTKPSEYYYGSTDTERRMFLLFCAEAASD